MTVPKKRTECSTAKDKPVGKPAITKPTPAPKPDRKSVPPAKGERRFAEKEITERRAPEKRRSEWEDEDDYRDDDDDTDRDDR